MNAEFARRLVEVPESVVDLEKKEPRPREREQRQPAAHDPRGTPTDQIVRGGKKQAIQNSFLALAGGFALLWRRQHGTQCGNQRQLKNHGAEHAAAGKHPEMLDHDNPSRRQRIERDRRDQSGGKHHRADTDQRLHHRFAARLTRRFGGRGLQAMVFLVITLEDLDRMARSYGHDQNGRCRIHRIYVDAQHAHQPQPPDHA